MNFQQMLTGFIDYTVDVAVPNQFIDGKLLAAGAADLVLQSTPPIYGPTAQITVPYRNISYVRVITH
ncbi:hypothetical protein LLE49_23205 [Alicyclobacillus tolerans]|uniref:hypothetical protein n=1 Tax=Alicyclobacillus tolerans TaxID=90970 RepID=UPI001F247126|nr:hypothetical protein [Alicyclobacillus tolerans]MCF8567631.1 hypothetical protein [Alicyclobacillus tolerans]